MRYNLGYMDMYPIEAAGSNIENNPMYRITFKDYINPILLEDAFTKAIEYYPLFGTKVKFDKEYYLETNKRPIKIFNVKEEERSKVFGKTTNGYPWQCCYYENRLTFEWLHGVSDGVGALNFLTHVLTIYCGGKILRPSKQFLIAPGLEPFFDKKEKGVNFKIDPEGFSFKQFKAHKDNGYTTHCHMLKAKTNEILNLAKTCESSVAPIITILFSQSIRKHLEENNIKKKDVACNVVLDLRRPLNYETMHNCVEYKRTTYQDRHALMSFKSVAKEYKENLDNARNPRNVVKIVTDRVKLFSSYHFLHSKKLYKLCAKVVGFFLKDTDCNFVMTYPGKIDFPPCVRRQVSDIDFRVWHDFGECIIACVDYKGTFNINISENFIDNGVVEEFIEISKNVGIHWNIVEEGIFEQAHFEE